MATAGIWHYLAIVLMCSSVCVGIYLITDYYMDDGWPSAFGQVCGESVEDDCLFINSHLNSLGILKYDDDISCMVQLNAGNRHGARYKLKFKWFELEYSENCSADSLLIYDTKIANTSFTPPIGRFCGKTEPNITGYPTQQYMTLKFQTDGSTGKKGYRILATRTLPYPCFEDYFHCKAENRCIDGRLKCDDTPQCDDGTDENDCSFWEKLLGGFLALGVSGIVGICFLIVILCTGICVTVCACTCCKKQCQCFSKICEKCCKPRDVNKIKPAASNVGGDDGTRKSLAGNVGETEVADKVAVKSPTETVPAKSSVPDDVTAEENPTSQPTNIKKTPLPSGQRVLSPIQATTGGAADGTEPESTVTKVD